MCVHIHVHEPAFGCGCVYRAGRYTEFTCGCVCSCVHTHTHAHAHSHAHTHTHTHAHTHISFSHLKSHHSHERANHMRTINRTAEAMSVLRSNVLRETLNKSDGIRIVSLISMSVPRNVCNYYENGTRHVSKAFLHNNSFLCATVQIFVGNMYSPFPRR